MSTLADGIIDLMRARFGTSPGEGGYREGGGGGGGRGGAGKRMRTVRCEVADARNLATVADGVAAVVVDKGTLDALHGDTHKMDMLRECSRCLRPDGGVIVSVSFPAAARVKLLDMAAAELGLQWRMRVVWYRVYGV